MNIKNHTYPLGRLFRFVILLEIMCWFFLGLIFIAIKWIDFKKEWAKNIIPNESQEAAKEWAQSYILNDLKPSFLNPNYVWFLLLLPLIWTIEGYYMIWKNKRLNTYSPKSIGNLFLQKIDSKRIKWRYFWLRNAIVFIVLALMQPVIGSKKISSNVHNQEVVICLDISNSMNVKDISNVDSRLDIAKRGIINYINTLRGERLGLCVFAGDAQILLPLTTDYHATKMFVNEISTDIISKQGTDINKALLTSSKMFTREVNSKISLIITDGENHEGSIVEGVREVKNKKVKLAVFGIGSNQGGYIPNDINNPAFGFKILPNGKRVISKLNKQFIASISNQVNGVGVILSNEYPDFQKYLTKIENIESKVKSIESEVKVKHNFYPLILGLGFFFLLIYFFYPYLLTSKSQTK
jgi:Ca-activated chloride channel family protein